MHPGELAVGFSDLEMTWLLFCAGAATVRAASTGCALYAHGMKVLCRLQSCLALCMCSVRNAVALGKGDGYCLHFSAAP